MTLSEARKILNVTSSSTKQEIKDAFRRLASKHHPDKGGDAGQFKKVKEAYDKLESSNFDKAAHSFNNYTDSIWDAYEHYDPFSSQSGYDRFSEFKQFTDDLKKRYQKYENEYSGEASGKATFSASVPVSLLDAFNGISNRKININIPSGNNLQTTVDIPAGVIDAETLKVIRFDDYNIVVTARITPLENVSVNMGTSKLGDISHGTTYTDIRVNPFTMITGGWVNVDLPFDDSAIRVRVIENTQPNAKMKIAGKGYWIDAKRRVRADLILTVVPDIKKLSEYDSSDIEEFIKVYYAVKRENP